MPTILLTNDDGVDAPGLHAARAALEALGEVIVVAPRSERSASSHALSLRRPLQLERRDPGVHAVDGTPVDCVFVACEVVLGGRRPDLLVSGINAGGNLGDDILYSGTVAAAVEGALRDIPAMAVSLVGRHDLDYDAAARFVTTLGRQILREGMAPRTVLNVNVPRHLALPARYRLTQVGQHRYRDVIEHLEPGADGQRLQIAGTWAGYEDIEGSDCAAVGQGLISVTPLQARFGPGEPPRSLQERSLDGFAQV
ncbi:MAG: 5'/3'-nucleotidase SurE [Pseudomonadota bacterium]